MLDPKAYKFASLLRLEEGIDVGPVKLLGDTSESLWQAMEIVAGFQVSSLARDNFMNTVLASYLPSFLRSFLADPFDLPVIGPQITNSWVLYSGWLFNLMLYPSFPRFVRAHNDEARTYHTRLADRIATIPEWIYTEPSVAEPIFSRLLPLFRIISQILLMHLPPNNGLPVLSPATRAGLRRAADRVQRFLLKNPSPSIGENVDAMRVLASGDRTMEGFRTTLLALPGGTVWWSCEAKRDRVVGLHECIELPPGEQMQACSRCLVVRYCSKAHQLAHWKRHKLSCVEHKW